MANGHGGKRPGAGRPRKQVVDWQQRNLLRFQSRFSEEDIDRIADAYKGALMLADQDAVKVLPYLSGPAPKEIVVSGPNGGPIEFIEVGDSE